MKLLSALACATLLFLTSSAYGQSRSVGAREIIIDNGAGGKLVIQYNGIGDDTLQIGNDGFGGSLPQGVSGQTLRHNGTEFDTTSTIFNDGQRVRVGGGINYGFRIISEDDSLLATDNIVKIEYSGDSLEIRMPEPTAGRQVSFIFDDQCGECGNPVMILPNDGEEIDEWEYYQFYPYYWAPRAATFVSDGTDWYVLSERVLSGN
jgi:hypothetical protein